MNLPSSANLRETARSPLTWHIAACALLTVLTLYLGTRLFLDWHATNTLGGDALAGQQAQLRMLTAQAKPLEGLPDRVKKAQQQIQEFYKKRIPPSYSSIAARFGELAAKEHIQLSRVQYTQGSAESASTTGVAAEAPDPETGLTEIRLDAGLTGDYAAIARFLNDLERDPDFFVIRTMALTGQQGGVVNLRLRVSTWLRPADAAASGLPQTPADDASTKNTLAGSEEEN